MSPSGLPKAPHAPRRASGLPIASPLLSSQTRDNPQLMTFTGLTTVPDYGHMLTMSTETQITALIAAYALIAGAVVTMVLTLT